MSGCIGISKDKSLISWNSFEMCHSKFLLSGFTKLFVKENRKFFSLILNSREYSHMLYYLKLPWNQEPSEILRSKKKPGRLLWNWGKASNKY